MPLCCKSGYRVGPDGEERCVTTLITAAKETRWEKDRVSLPSIGCCKTEGTTFKIIFH